MALVLDGTNGLTFPNSTTQASAGKVLQVVQNSMSGQFTTTSGSFVTSGLAASITPTAATSKILILVTCNNSVITVSAAHTWITVYRNSTNLGSGTPTALYGIYGGSTGNLQGNGNISYLDSPATTSSTTYTVYVSTDSGQQGGFNWNGQTSYIQLLEIAA